MKPKRTKLIEKLDEVFGDYIRNRDKGKCFTCDKVIDPSNRTDLNPGHVFSRRHLGTRWDECNVFAQCRNCNYRQNLVGNGSAVLRAIDLVGKAAIDEVEAKTRQISKISIKDLESMIEEYEEKLERVKCLYQKD